MKEKTILTALAVLLMASFGCVSEKSTPAAAPPASKPTTFSQELLVEQIKIFLMTLAYDNETAQRVAVELVGWKDGEGNPLVGALEGELIDTRKRYQEGEITIDELTEVEVKITRELGWKIKEKIPNYTVENWHLEDVITDQGANCVGYTQLLFVLGNSVGLSVEPIEVLEVKDVKEGHVTGLIGLSDERKAMVELTSTSAFTTQAFKLEDEYREVGNYLELIDDESMIPHTRIRRLNKDGLMASLFISRAKNYYSSGEHERAITENGVAIGLDPKYALAYNNRGAVLHHLGYYFDALADFDMAIELDPRFADAYGNRGVVHAAVGNYSSAISDYDKAIELDPGHASAYYGRGDAYAGLEEYSQAISDYDKAIELNPDYDKAFYSRGVAFANLGENKKAIEDYDKTIELNPYLAEAYSNRGIVYAVMKDYSRAISDYDKAIELKPESAASHYNRGNARYNLGEYEKAAADYTRAIELDPKLAEAYNNRGAIYIRLGESQKAQDDFDKAASLDPRFER